jgi:Na+/H+-translocating membrane pyrophosphatase
MVVLTVPLHGLPLTALAVSTATCTTLVTDVAFMPVTTHRPCRVAVLTLHRTTSAPQASCDQNFSFVFGGGALCGLWKGAFARFLPTAFFTVVLGYFGAMSSLGRVHGGGGKVLVGKSSDDTGQSESRGGRDELDMKIENMNRPMCQ